MYNEQNIDYIEVYTKGRYIDVMVDKKYLDEINKRHWIMIGDTSVGHQSRTKGIRVITLLRDLVYKLANPDDDRIDNPDYVMNFVDGCVYNLTASNLELKLKETLQPDYHVKFMLKQDKAYYC